jgi:hypothetical protein
VERARPLLWPFDLDDFDADADGEVRGFDCSSQNSSRGAVVSGSYARALEVTQRMSGYWYFYSRCYALESGSMKPASTQTPITERNEDADSNEARIALRLRCRSITKCAQPCIALVYKISASVSTTRKAIAPALRGTDTRSFLTP